MKRSTEKNGMCSRRGRRWGSVLAVLMLMALQARGASAQTERAAGESSAPGSAPAAEEIPEKGADAARDDWKNAPAERRSGFLIGIAAGPSLGGASGYPNDSLKIDREAYYTNTGVGIGGSVEAWLGGSLSDWLNFGVGPCFGNVVTADYATGFFSGMLRLEVFPLYSLGEQWREVGLVVEGGVGFSQTTATDDADTKLIDSGGASRLGLGGFWEGIRLWKISMGPFAAADFIWSPSSLRPLAWVGWRTSFYTGP